MVEQMVDYVEQDRGRDQRRSYMDPSHGMNSHSHWHGPSSAVIPTTATLNDNINNNVNSKTREMGTIGRREMGINVGQREQEEKQPSLVMRMSHDIMNYDYGDGEEAVQIMDVANLMPGHGSNGRDRDRERESNSDHIHKFVLDIDKVHSCCIFCQKVIMANSNSSNQTANTQMKESTAGEDGDVDDLPEIRAKPSQMRSEAEKLIRETNSSVSSFIRQISGLAVSDSDPSMNRSPSKTRNVFGSTDVNMFPLRSVDPVSVVTAADNQTEDLDVLMKRRSSRNVSFQPFETSTHHEYENLSLHGAADRSFMNRGKRSSFDSSGDVDLTFSPAVSNARISDVDIGSGDIDQPMDQPLTTTALKRMESLHEEQLLDEDRHGSKIFKGNRMANIGEKELHLSSNFADDDVSSPSPMASPLAFPVSSASQSIGGGAYQSNFRTHSRINVEHRTGGMNSQTHGPAQDPLGNSQQPQTQVHQLRQAHHHRHHSRHGASPLVHSTMQRTNHPVHVSRSETFLPTSNVTVNPPNSTAGLFSQNLTLQHLQRNADGGKYGAGPLSPLGQSSTMAMADEDLSEPATPSFALERLTLRTPTAAEPEPEGRFSMGRGARIRPWSTAKVASGSLFAPVSVLNQMPRPVIPQAPPAPPAPSAVPTLTGPLTAGGYDLNRRVSPSNHLVLSESMDYAGYFEVESPDVPYRARRYLSLLWNTSLFCLMAEDGKVSWKIPLCGASVSGFPSLTGSDSSSIVIEVRKVSASASIFSQPKSVARRYIIHTNSFMEYSFWLERLIIASQRSLRGDYALANSIGHGAFATVYAGEEVNSRCSYAIRVVDRIKQENAGENMDCFDYRELLILRKLESDFFVSVYRVYDTPAETSFVMDFVRGGTLADVRSRTALSLDEIALIMFDILSGIRFLHRHKIAHRDLKMENVLCTAKTFPLRCKLADFGLANFIVAGSDSVGLFQSQVGSPQYLAPEILNHMPYKHYVDMWAAGVILYNLIFSEYPFDGSTMEQVKAVIDKNHTPYRNKPQWTQLPPDVQRLLESLLHRNPLRRATAEDALRNGWIQAVASRYGYIA